jgi:hypothetical protein
VFLESLSLHMGSSCTYRDIFQGRMIGWGMRDEGYLMDGKTSHEYFV